MLYQSFTPSAPLRQFIERFWYCSAAPYHHRERILPSGTIELVINLRDDEIRIYDAAHVDSGKRFPGAVISGAYSGPFVIDPQVHASMLGVHFRPGGAFPFLGIPARELADAHVDLRTLWGPAGNEMRDRLCGAAGLAAKCKLLEELLLARLHDGHECHPAVSPALKLFEGCNEEVCVGNAARNVGLSQRQFIQVFAAEVGMTPKRYCRVRRFQRTLEVVRRLPRIDWARIAAECGYYDQSHLIHEFRAFSGASPTEFLRQQSEDLLPNHVLPVG